MVFVKIVKYRGSFYKYTFILHFGLHNRNEWQNLLSTISKYTLKQRKVNTVNSKEGELKE